jgi:cleavage and polyadenylation specificity factor subunit 3
LLLLQLPLRAKVEEISFSAHADYDQTKQFLDELAPPHVVLVHGEFNEMMRLRTVSQQGAAGMLSADVAVSLLQTCMYAELCAWQQP